MKSPFPGMDPYLEQHWGDIHHRLITYACDSLQEQLPGDLRARMEERIFVESPGSPSVAVADPILVHVGDEPARQAFIEIIDAGSGNRVVTVIEFLSPANKLPGEGQDLYLRKQRELKAGRVSLAEIDLLRTGKRVLAIPPERLAPARRAAYQACVRRAWKPDIVEVYPLPLRERLPAIKLPLRETDADPVLDLQALINQCYVKGRYDDQDYAIPPRPPLDEADVRWAASLIQGRPK